MQNKDWVYELLKEQFGQDAVVPKRYDYFLKEGWIDAAREERQDVNWLCERVRRFLQAAEKPHRQEEHAPSLTSEQRQRANSRHEVLSLLVATAAAEDEEVADFRTKHLAGKLLKPEEVEPWIKEKAAADGPTTVWITLPFAKGHEVMKFTRIFGNFTIGSPVILENQPISKIERVFLPYAVPADNWRRLIPVAYRGVLHHLKTLADRLANKNDWQETQATIFVLTGLSPLIPAVKSSVRPNRIVLDFDPFVTPKELSDHYSRLRTRVGLTRRTRKLKEKHYRLAAFLGQSGKDESWKGRFTRWNKTVAKGKNRKWRYGKESNFRRDCLKAKERVLSSPLSATQIL